MKPSNPMRNLYLLLILGSHLLLIPPHMHAQNKKDTVKASGENVYKDVRRFVDKDNWFSRLVRNILVVDQDSTTPQSMSDTSKQYRRFKGKIVRNINVLVLDVFGPTLHKPKDQTTSWVQRKGNMVHVNTQESTIRNKLLFSEGDQVVPLEMAESERLLRQTNYIYDAKITLHNIPGSKDSVDVEVVTQDLWSISMNGSYESKSGAADISFTDANFIGFGNEFFAQIRFKEDISSEWAWNGSYIIDNIARENFVGRMYYLSDRRSRSSGFSINRDFISPVYLWAGGLSLQWNRNSIPASPTTFQDLQYAQQDVWAGYAVNGEFYVAGRALNTRYTTRPVSDTSHTIQNNIFYLGSVGYAHRTFYVDNFVFGLGKTEDISIGYLLSFTAGYEDGEFLRRPYYGISIAASNTVPRFGYLYGKASAGGFRNAGDWENGIIACESKYFSNLMKLGIFPWRTFLSAKFSYNYNPPGGAELLTITDEGIRGSAPSLAGNKRFVLNSEADFFMPVTFIGFRFGLIVFADFGWIAPRDEGLFEQQLQQGYGIGIRIRNEHLIFRTIQIMFGFYPNATEKTFSVFSRSGTMDQLNQFQFSRPSPITF